MESMRLGIDLGGTKIEIIALDSDGTELARRRVESPRTYNETLRTLVELVEGVESDLGRQGTVGMGIPGAISPATGLVKNANSTWLIGHPLNVDLAKALDRPVRVANDANCFALSEATDGAGAGCATVFGVILGTGVGGGLVVDGRIVRGAQSIGGEWGHNPLPWPRGDESPGRRCYCGKFGCIETFVSGPGMQRDHHHRFGEEEESARIVDRAQSGDMDCIVTVQVYVDRLARGLATVVNVVDPDMIVLGGGMSNIPELDARVAEELPKYVFTDHLATRVRENLHGDSSGVRGAAWLWDER